jgi:probable F420-dependent oxidoreductase
MATKRLSVSMVAPSHDPIPASALAHFAQRVEAAGYYALYVTDHIFHQSPTFHSTSAFAVIASATTSIPLGFGAYIVPFRHPIVAAKELAALDGLSDGRLIPGLAAGSSKAEFDAFGIPFSERGKRLDESLIVIKKLWTEESTTYHGDFYSFDNVSLTPKPVQSPNLPIWIGSWTGSRPAARRIVTHATGWQASGLHADINDAVEGWKRLEDMCTEMGRDPSTIRRSLVNLVVRVGADHASAMAQIPPSHRMHDEYIVAGSVQAVTDRLLEFYDTGIEEIAVFLPTTAIDQVDLIAEAVMPQLI